MKTARFLPAQIWTITQADAGNAVYIRPEGTDKVLPVYVAEADIQVLLVELTHILAPRPMVHELLLSAIDSLHGKMSRVEIYGIKGGSYLCRVVLSQGGKEIRLESRPSDILCLSARVDCPIFVDDGVLVQNGIPIEQVNAASGPESAVSDPPSVLAFLQHELKLALDHEEYERAALLRDRLAEMSRIL